MVRWWGEGDDTCSREVVAESLVLDEGSLIGEGTKRQCYIHPEDSDLCVKVARYPEKWKLCQQQSFAEWAYFEYLNSQGRALGYVADCLGWACTNRGLGLIVERVLEADGSPALTLREALRQERLSAERAEALLGDLRGWVRENAVLVVDWNLDNLLVTNRSGEDALVIVDGFGGKRLGWKFQLQLRFPFLARWKARRAWQRQKGKFTFDSVGG